MADFQQNFMNSLAGGFQFGQQVRGVQDRNKLNQLASLAYQAPADQRQEILGQAAAVDAGQAGALDRQLGNNDDQRNKTMANMAQLLVNAPEQARAGLYQQMVPTLAKFGLQDLPQQYDAQTAPIIDQAARSIYQAYSGTAGQTPTDVRSFQMMTQGLSPEERERARRINLGLAGRESSAAIGYQKVRGPDGVDRLVAVDPRQIGAQVVGDGTGYGSFSQPAPMAGGADGNHFAAFSQLATEFPAVTMTSGARSAERNAQVGGQPNSQHLNGSAADYAVPANQKPAFISRARQLGYQAIDEGDHIHLQLPRGSAGSGGQNIFAGRRPEDEAAAVESAKLGVQQQYLPQELALRTDAALRQEAGKAAVSAQADQNKTQVTRVRDANTALDLLDQAEALLPMATGSFAGAALDRGAAAFGRSTEGARATAGLKAIGGQLTSKMPRMEGPQSDKDVQLYKEMAGDLANDTLPVETRMAALRVIRGLQQKYAGGGRSADAPRRIQSAEDYNALPSGALFIAPDGTQRRKR